MESEFKKTLKQHRDSLAEELLQLGKYREAQLVEWDIERNESDYEFYFNSGWNAQQSKVDELQKQRDSFIKAYEIEMDKSVELQKRVDAAKQLIEDLNKCYQQDHQNKFEYWRGFADSAGILGKRLEQALKGGGE